MTVLSGNDIVSAMIKLTQAIPGQKTWKDYGLADLRSMDAALSNQAPVIYEQAHSAEAALAMLKDSLGIVAGMDNLTVETPLETVTIDQNNLLHLIEKRDNARERYANYILPTLQSPIEIWGTDYDDGNTRNRYIGVFTGKYDIAAIVRVGLDGRILWNIMNAERKRMNKFREGKLLWSK